MINFVCLLKELREVVLVLASGGEWEALSKAMGLNPGHRVFLFKNLRLRVLITGVGIAAMASGLAADSLDHDAADAYINAGLGGCFNAAVEPGSLFRITSERLPELGAEDPSGMLPYTTLGLYSTYDLPMRADGIIPAPEMPDVLLRRIHLPVASGITVNLVHGKEEGIRGFFPLNGILVESMEGAAFFMVCHRFGLKGVQIRAISNRVEPRNRSAWRIEAAIQSLASCLKTLLEEGA